MHALTSRKNCLEVMELSSITKLLYKITLECKFCSGSAIVIIKFQ
jgi:hypothetical protein